MKLTVIVLLAFVLFSCGLVAPGPWSKLEISVSFSDSQNDLQQIDRDSDGSNEWVFPLYFPNVTDIAGSAGGEIVSTGHASGASVISISMVTNRTIYLTGARIDQIYYRPSGASSEIGYIHPVYGIMNPFFLEMPGGDTVTVAESSSGPITIELDLATVLALWSEIDADGDGVLFPADQDESISLSCRLFFDGYTDAGRDLPESYPPPLRLYFTISHLT